MACVVFVVLAAGEREAHAQGHDSLMNGAIIGAAVGAGAGVAFTHAARVRPQLQPVRLRRINFRRYRRGGGPQY
jgi:hypothetical protein